MEDRLIKKVNSIVEDMKIVLDSGQDIELNDAVIIDDELDVKEDIELDMTEDISKILKDIIITPSYSESEIELKDAIVVDDKLNVDISIPSKLYRRWTEEEANDLRKYYFYCVDHREEAERYFQRKWEPVRSKASYLGLTPLMKINRKCPMFLGYCVAERVLSYVFKDVERMPIHNHGFDFICNKGYKIDVKASCLRKNNTYSFSFNCNKIADYFLCIGFDNRENLTPQHIWLIKGSLVNEVKQLTITNTEFGLSQLSDYELIDKVKDVIDCCNELKK